MKKIDAGENYRFIEVGAKMFRTRIISLTVPGTKGVRRRCRGGDAKIVQGWFEGGVKGVQGGMKGGAKGMQRGCKGGFICILAVPLTVTVRCTS